MADYLFVFGAVTLSGAMLILFGSALVAVVREVIASPSDPEVWLAVAIIVGGTALIAGGIMRQGSM